MSVTTRRFRFDPGHSEHSLFLPPLLRLNFELRTTVHEFALNLTTLKATVDLISKQLINMKTTKKFKVIFLMHFRLHIITWSRRVRPPTPLSANALRFCENFQFLRNLKLSITQIIDFLSLSALFDLDIESSSSFFSDILPICCR